MKSTCRFLFFLAFTGWIYTGCEPHSLNETETLHRDHHGHDDDHDGGHDGDHDHGKADSHKEDHKGDSHDKDHKGEEKDHSHKGDHPKAGKKGAPKESVKAKEEPRNLGL